MEKECKSCKTIIHKDASICPHCRSKQGMGNLSKIIIAALFLFIGLPLLFGSCATDEPKKARTMEQIESQKTVKTLTGKAETVKNIHPDWPDEVCIAIGEDRLVVGMTIAQIEEVWGPISTVNSSENSYGIHRQWIFGEGTTKKYAYTDNGKLTSWQY